MCTVTFVPKGSEGFILTSNRDEAPGRRTLPPEFYEIEGATLLFPKDAVAGGTWIGVSNTQRIICLLNGGFTAHDRKDNYRMSRGIIVKDLLVASEGLSAMQYYDYTNIEPFTIIMVDWKSDVQLIELVWDGERSHISQKPLAPSIWSSSLLYSEEVKRKREYWFSRFLLQDVTPSEAALLDFHKTAGDGNIATDVIMDRGFVKTKSITQIVKRQAATMRYEDLQTKEVYTRLLEL
ncbi:MAG: NRDE family protein [Altibacter sp.]|nr:NRDE family protein [Altibacter sp.]